MVSKVVLKGLDAARHTVKSYKALGKKITLEDKDKAAHIIRGRTGYMAYGTDDLTDEQVETALRYNHLLNNAKTHAEQEELDFLYRELERITPKVSKEHVHDRVKSSALTLDKPVYVTRQESTFSKTADAPSDHILSAKIVDPEEYIGREAELDVGYMENAAWKREMGMDPQNIYKLEPGSEILHTLDLADEAELLVTRGTLDKSKSTSTKDYAEAIKKGSVPFGVGAMALLNTEDSFAQVRTDGPNETKTDKKVTFNNGQSVINLQSADELVDGVPSRVVSNLNMEVTELELSNTDSYITAALKSELDEASKAGRQQLVTPISEPAQSAVFKKLASEVGAEYTESEGLAKFKPGVSAKKDYVSQALKMATALEQGYTQEEVTSYLANQGLDENSVSDVSAKAARVLQARQAGYTDEEVVEYLNSKQVSVANIENTPATAEKVEPKWAGSYWPVPSNYDLTNPYKLNNDKHEVGYYGAVPKGDAYKALVSDQDMTAEQLLARLKVIAPNMANMSTRALGFLGNQEAAVKAEQGVQASRTRIVQLAAERGLNIQWDKKIGEFTTEEGVPITEDTWESIKSEKMEMIGGVAGATAGFKLGARLGVPGAVAGSVLGASIGAAAGSSLDYLQQSIVLQADMEAQVAFHKAFTAAETSVLFDLGILGVGKYSKNLYKGLQRVKNFIVDNNTKGAIQAIKEVEFLTDAQAEELVTQLARVAEVPGSSADLNKIAAIALTKPGSEALVKASTAIDPRASGAIGKAIDDRAKDLLATTAELSNDNVQRILREDLSNYIYDVKSFYGSVKAEAVLSPKASNFRFDFNKLAIMPALENIYSGLRASGNPEVLQKFANQMTYISDMSDGRTFGDLLELRQLVNEFRFNKKITKQKDMQFLSDTVKSIDEEISRGAYATLENPKKWLSDYASARKSYADMKRVEGNVMYKALTAPGVSANDVSETLSKYITALDGTYQDVVDRLPVKMRAQVENATIDTLANRYAAGLEGGQRAIHFPMLAKELNLVTFSTKESRQMKEAINVLADVFKNDVPLSQQTGSIQIPTFQSYLTTDPFVRAQYEAASKVFNSFKAKLPGKEGRNLALLKNTAEVLREPLKTKSMRTLMDELAPLVDVQDSVLKLQQAAAEQVSKKGYAGAAKVLLYGDGNLLSATKVGKEHKVPLQAIADTDTAMRVAERYGINYANKDLLHDFLQKEGYQAVQTGTDKVLLLKGK